jgi:ABC-2 type transport system ATP-binding protein
MIHVQHFTKIFRVHEKPPGLRGAISALFKRRYREVHAVEDISFMVGRGELVGFLGPNGAGKTTTLKVLSGLLYPNAGEVKVLGFLPWERRPDFLKRISLVMGQRHQLWWELPARETFLLNKEIYGLSQGQYDRSLGELSELLDLEELNRIPVKKLSLGQRMKCELAASLIHRPEVLFLDEPTLGLDVLMQKKLREFISNYNRAHRATILLTSHNMDDVSTLCRRVILIDHGRLVYDGQLDDLVASYAPTKRIRMDFETPVGLESLRSLGLVVKAENSNVQMEVARGDVARTASEILAKFPVADLTIEEPPLEEVIGRIFQP